MTKRNHLQSNPSNYADKMREEKRKDMVDIYSCFHAYAMWKTYARVLASARERIT
jgi:hypothetical protein